jgi:hypothetical protein
VKSEDAKCSATNYCAFGDVDAADYSRLGMTVRAVENGRSRQGIEMVRNLLVPDVVVERLLRTSSMQMSEVRN